MPSTTTEVQIYELGDIAAILGIEKSRVKSWTIGRPFSVRASVRASFGKGSRNLFSRQDVYCFALVHRLNEVGVPVAAIQGMLEKFRPYLLDDAFWKNSGWLFLKRTNRDVSYEGDFDPNEFGYLNIPIKPEDELVCSYAINLKPIADDVSARINVFSHRRDPAPAKKVKKDEPSPLQLEALQSMKKGAPCVGNASKDAENNNPRWLHVGTGKDTIRVSFRRIRPWIKETKRTEEQVDYTLAAAAMPFLQPAIKTAAKK